MIKEGYYNILDEFYPLFIKVLTFRTFSIKRNLMTQYITLKRS